MRTYEHPRPLSKPSSVNLQKQPAGFLDFGWHGDGWCTPMLWISTSQKITWITCWMLAYRFLRSQHRWPLRTNLLMAMSQRRPKPPTRQHDEHMWEGRNLEVTLNFGWWDWCFNLTFFVDHFIWVTVKQLKRPSLQATTTSKAWSSCF